MLHINYLYHDFVRFRFRGMPSNVETTHACVFVDRLPMGSLNPLTTLSRMSCEELLALLVADQHDQRVIEFVRGEFFSFSKKVLHPQLVLCLGYVSPCVDWCL